MMIRAYNTPTRPEEMPQWVDGSDRAFHIRTAPEGDSVLGCTFCGAILLLDPIMAYGDFSLVAFPCPNCNNYLMPRVIDGSRVVGG